MSDLKKAVACALEQLSDELGTLDAELAKFEDRLINHAEKVSLLALIEYRAYVTKYNPAVVRMSFETAFNIDDLGDLYASRYDEGVAYLCDWNGFN